MSSHTKRIQYIKLDRLLELCEDQRKKEGSDHGYGIKNLRKFCGISNTSMNRVIYENKDFSADNLYRLATKTGCSIDWLLGISDKKWRDRYGN